MDIKIIDRTIGLTLEIEHRTSMFGMPKAMGEGFGAIDQYMKTKGAAPKEAPFARYPEIDWEGEVNAGGLINFVRMLFKKWHFFTGFPCSDALPGEGSIRSGNLGKQRFVSCLHVGPYRDVGKVYKAMWSFARRGGLKIEPWCLELYLNDPRAVGQAKAETLCLMPVAP